MAKRFLNTNEFSLDVVAKTITFANIVPNLTLSDIGGIKSKEGDSVKLIYDGVTPGCTGTLNGKVLTLDADLTGLTNNSLVAIEVDNVLLLNISLIDEDNKFYYENSNLYKNKNNGLLNIFETDNFNIRNSGLYEFKIILNGTNEDDGKAFEVYSYLDNDPTKQISKVVGYATKDNEYHTESRDNVIYVENGVHSVFVKLETNEEGKEASINSYKLIIKAL